MKVPFFRSSLIVALMLSQGCSSRGDLPGDVASDVKALTARATIANNQAKNSTVEVSKMNLLLHPRRSRPRKPVLGAKCQSMSTGLIFTTLSSK